MDPLRAALTIAALITIGAVVRLFVLGVPRQLPWLTAFLSFSAFQLVVPGLIFPMTSRIYRDLYFFSEPVTWMLAVLIIQEMYHHVFQQYPAISGLGKFSTIAAAVTAVLVCTAMITVTPAHQLTPRVIQTYTIFWEMCTFFTLGIFIVFMILIIGRYPLKLDPNFIKNIAIFSGYFFVTVFILTVFQSDRGQLARDRAYAVIGLQTVCATLWGVLLRKPMSAPVVDDSLPEDGEAAHLLRQLAHINNMLARSVRQ